MIPHVLEVDKSRLSIKFGDDLMVGPTPVICYDSVPLWRTACSLSSVKIFVAGGDVDEDCEGGHEPYMLMCHDSMDDYYTYGEWKTLDDVKAWLENPVSLY